MDDSSEVRFVKIARIIEQCRYGVHDISSVSLDEATGLPRFNMPLELGLYLGCKRFGPKLQHKKACLILDTEQYRYRAFISDIAGQDIHAHHCNPEHAIVEVRDWLCAVSKRKRMPGGAEIARRYKRFRLDLPVSCRKLRRKEENLTFPDLLEMVEIWLEADR